jgi:hypothetical protein
MQAVLSFVQSNTFHVGIARQRMVLGREAEGSKYFDRTLIGVPRHACFVRLEFRFVRPDLLRSGIEGIIRIR